MTSEQGNVVKFFIKKKSTTPYPLVKMSIQQNLFLVIEKIVIKNIAEYLLANTLAHAQHHLLVRLNDKIDFSHLDKLAAKYHHASGAGAPVEHSGLKMIRALLVKYLYDLSLRELEERLNSDLLVRWFVGYTFTERAPDHTTLERFEMWVNAEHHSEVFDEILRQIGEAFPRHGRVQIGDTYAMQANAAKESTVTLMRHLGRRLVEGAEESIPVALKLALDGYDLEKLLKPEKGKPEWLYNESERAALLSRVALAARELHERLSQMLAGRPTDEFPRLRQDLSALEKVFKDNLVFENDHARACTQKELGHFRLGSATDLDATFRVHGKGEGSMTLGYNIQIAISQKNFIQTAIAFTGASGDQSSVAALVSGQENPPDKLIYDKAAGTGKTRAEVHQASGGKTLLSAQLPDYASRNQVFSSFDFLLSSNGAALTCPNGKTSPVAYPSQSGDGRVFRFFDFHCWSGSLPPAKKTRPDPACAVRCPLWDQCREKDMGPRSIRQVFVTNYRSQVEAAQIYNHTDEFKQDMKLRPTVERVIFELTHYNGARRCRRIGLNNADWQAKMCAVAYNLKLWMRLTMKKQKQTGPSVG